MASLESEADQSNWIDLKWTAEAQANSISIGRVVATLRNEPGVLARIAGSVGDAGGNIANVKTLHRTVDFFDMEFDLEVMDSRHLNNIIAALKTNDCVISVERARAD